MVERSWIKSRHFHNFMSCTFWVWNVKQQNEGEHYSLSVLSVFQEGFGLRYVLLTHIPAGVIRLNKKMNAALVLHQILRIIQIHKKYILQMCALPSALYSAITVLSVVNVRLRHTTWRVLRCSETAWTIELSWIAVRNKLRTQHESSVDTQT
jgi:hypothetical protein